MAERQLKLQRGLPLVDFAKGASTDAWLHHVRRNSTFSATKVLLQSRRGEPEWPLAS
jgi:hypothetical protein